MSHGMHGRIHFDVTGLDEAQRKTIQATQSINHHLRTVSQMAILVTQATGGAVDQILALQIEAAIQAIETTINIRTAMVAGVGPMGILGIATSAIAIGFLIYTIHQLKRRRADSARQTQMIASSLRMFAYI